MGQLFGLWPRLVEFQVGTTWIIAHFMCDFTKIGPKGPTNLAHRARNSTSLRQGRIYLAHRARNRSILVFDEFNRPKAEDCLIWPFGSSIVAFGDLRIKFRTKSPDRSHQRCEIGPKFPPLAGQLGPWPRSFPFFRLWRNWSRQGDLRTNFRALLEIYRPKMGRKSSILPSVWRLNFGQRPIYLAFSA